MRKTFLSFFLYFAGCMAASAGSVSTQDLVDDFFHYQSLCRGGSGSSLKTWRACGARDYVGFLLNELGLCYGKADQATVFFEWHSCSSGSLRSNIRPGANWDD